MLNNLLKKSGRHDEYSNFNDDIEAPMTWREFEKICEDLIHKSLDPEKWRIQYQRKKKYKDGATKIMDIHIAERRQGGRCIVVDCKHFPKAKLNRHEIESVLDYKKRSKASIAIMMISKDSRYDESFLAMAEEYGIKTLIVDPYDQKGLFSFFRKIFLQKNEIEKLLESNL